MADEYDGYITKTEAIKTVMFGANRPLIIAEIKAIPSADVQPVVHGKWVFDGYNYRDPYVCNICGACADYESNFCPNCGAGMREES